MRRGRGFTLLEVMISLAILAVSLVALSDLNGGAVQMHAYARRSTQATLLLQSKMLDLEDLVQKEGFRDFDDERHGTFEEEGAQDYAWRADILRPDIKLDDSALLGFLGVHGPGKAAVPGTAPAPGALAAAGPLAGVLQTQAKGFVETLKKSVRELRVTVTWKDGRRDRAISASQQFVLLPEQVGKEGQVQQAPLRAPGPLPGLPPLNLPAQTGLPEKRR